MLALGAVGPVCGALVEWHRLQTKPLVRQRAMEQWVRWHDLSYPPAAELARLNSWAAEASVFAPFIALICAISAIGFVGLLFDLDRRAPALAGACIGRCGQCWRRSKAWVSHHWRA